MIEGKPYILPILISLKDVDKDKFLSIDGSSNTTLIVTHNNDKFNTISLSPENFPNKYCSMVGINIMKCNTRVIGQSEKFKVTKYPNDTISLESLDDKDMIKPRYKVNTITTITLPFTIPRELGDRRRQIIYFSTIQDQSKSNKFFVEKDGLLYSNKINIGYFKEDFSYSYKSWGIGPFKGCIIQEYNGFWIGVYDSQKSCVMGFLPYWPYGINYPCFSGIYFTFIDGMLCVNCINNFSEVKDSNLNISLMHLYSPGYYRFYRWDDPHNPYIGYINYTKTQHTDKSFIIEDEQCIPTKIPSIPTTKRPTITTQRPTTTRRPTQKSTSGQQAMNHVLIENFNLNYGIGIL